MAHRPIRVVPAAALREGFEAIRREAHVPTAFPPEAEAEARAVARAADGRARRRPLRDDRPARLARPRPGAAHRAARRRAPRPLRDRRRRRVRRARRRARRRGPRARRHRLRARRQDAAAPARPVGGRREPAPGAVDARPCCGRSTSTAPASSSRTDVARAEVRSVAQHTYADVPAPVAELLAEVGERRLALELARGGVRLEVPEQEVVREDGSWTVRYRVPLATEDHNAQISLLTGMAAAQLMLRAGTGILRTQPRARRALARAPAPPGPRARRVVAALDVLPRLRPQPRSRAAGPRRAHARGDGRRPRRRLHRVRRRAARRAPSTSRSPAPTPTRPRRCAACRTATSPSAASPRRRARRSPTGSAPGSPRCPTP